VAALAIALIVVVVLLSIVIINQNNKIKEMQRPKYGFLGKPIYAVLLIVFSVGGFGLVYYGANKPLDVQQTEANRQVEVTIRAFSLSAGSDTYSITLIPLINGKAWGNDNTNKFDIYWTITNTTVTTEVELGRILYSQGGLIKKLAKGVNKIKATVFFDGQSYDKEIQVTV